MQVSAILDNIERRGLSLPMFQRGYVWTRPQVKKLMNSMYRGYPVGGLLIWETRAEDADIRGDNVSASGAISLLLDGQQRVTSLFGIIRGSPPPFFDGDSNAFNDLYFNLHSQEFEFRSPLKMALDTRWVNVSQLFEARGVSSILRELDRSNAYSDDQLNDYEERALRVVNIRNADIPIQIVSGEDKTTDVVVEIFNEVNAGGRKLSNADLALARVGGQWPEVRDIMRERLDKWEKVGFSADRDWLLRCITAVAADSADFGQLKDVPIADIRDAMDKVDSVVDNVLDVLRTYLGMDSDKVHNTKHGLSVMVKYLVNMGGQFPDDTTKAKLLYWYLNSLIWGRFAGTTETTLNRDLAALRTQDPVGSLLSNIRQEVGDRKVEADHFNVERTNTRFYLLLHALSRVWGARDWGTGRRLPDHDQADWSALELHHIFPKRVLRDAEISADLANNLGNRSFQTRNTNLGIKDREPAEYMQAIQQNQPGALESQWVPIDSDLRQVEHYDDFLAQRRLLLAEASNDLLEWLQSGYLPTPAERTVSANLDPEEEEAILDELNSFVAEHGLPAGELGYEILDDRGEVIAILDLAWPKGLQDGFSDKVAILINEDHAVRIAANARQFHQIFTTPDQFKTYVIDEILGRENFEEPEDG